MEQREHKPQSDSLALSIEQNRLLYSGLSTSLIANAVLASILVAVQWTTIDKPLIVTWLSLMAIVLSGRLVSTIRYRKAGPDAADSALYWLNQFRRGAIAAGLVWGLSALLLFPPGRIEFQVFMGFILAGVCAGAITSLSSDRVSALGFVFATLGPLAVRFFTEPGTMPFAMGVMVVMFLAFVMASARRMQRTLIDNVRLRNEAQSNETALEQEKSLNEIISRAQSQFIIEDDRRKAFDQLLIDILDVTGSEYGFIGDVLYKDDRTPFLKTYAITNIAWNDETREYYEAHAPQGMEFLNLDTLFGHALQTGEPVISNNPLEDPRSGGLPEGHPPLNAFLGIPIHQGGKLIAMLGIANRPGGYDENLITFLQPLLITIGQLVAAARTRQQHVESQLQLARLSRVAAQTTNGVVISDAEGRIEWINEGFTRLTGYTLEDVLGKKPGELQQGDATNPETVALMGKALGNGEGFEVDIVNYKKDGSPYWKHISCNPLLDNHGKIQGYMAIESDITEQKKIESELNQFKNTLDQTLDCVFMFDAKDLRFFYVNEGALQQVGYSRDELLSMHPYDIKPEIPETEFLEMIAPLLSGEKLSLTFETVHQHKNGTQVPVEIFLQYIAPPDGVARFVAIVRDITERKRIEKIKSEFISTVSHELRTPLTAISGSLQLFLGGVLGEVPDEVREMIDIAYRNTQRLTYLVNDLLDMEQIEAGKMTLTLQEQPLPPLIRQALEANQHYGADRHVSLIIDGDIPDATVMVDDLRLLQVLSNLVSNAIKFSPDNETVVMSVARHNGVVRISVTDQGPGIPVEFQEHIFEKFAQADSSDTRQKGGSGLGLAISQQLVMEMHGSLGFDSRENNGTTFWVELPCK